jgi:monoamine oxidase
LAAARRLTGEGRSVVVLEARDRVGGRTCTVEEAGATVDLGGQWIGPTQDHIYELAPQTGVATFPQWTGGEDVVLEDGQRAGGSAARRATTERTSPSARAQLRRCSRRRTGSRSTVRGRHRKHIRWTR